MVDVKANFTGAMPEFYDSIMGPAQFGIFGDDLVRRLPARHEGAVLEIACGTGIVTRRLRERLEPGVKLVASDLSEAMLGHARGKVAGEVDWRIADAARLPFESGSFAAAVCAFGVMFVPDKKAAFGEARRVLRDGGTFLFNVWDGLEANPQSRATNDVVDALFPGDAEMRFSTPFVFNDRAVLGALLDGARLREVKMDVVRLPIRAPSARDYAVGQLRGTPRGALFEKRGVPIESVIDRVAAALVPIGGDKPFECTGQALVIEARAA
jgi:SAM-dependent methyltransferase